MKSEIMKLLKSKRFFVFLAYLLVVVLRAPAAKVGIELTEDNMYQLLVVAASVVAGFSVRDPGQLLKPPPPQ